MPPPVLLPLRSCEAAGRAPPGARAPPAGGPGVTKPTYPLRGATETGRRRAGGETPLPAVGACEAPRDRARRPGGVVAAVPAARQGGGDPFAEEMGGACPRYRGGVGGRVPGTGRFPPPG